MDNAAEFTNVLISEVFYDTPGTDSVEEWVELYNPTAQSIDLSGYTLQDNVDTFVIPQGTSIGAHDTLVIARNATGFYALYGFYPDISGLNLALGNSGDVLVLYHGGTEIDMVAWENYVPGWGLFASTGQSIQRSPPEQDTNTSDDWVVADTPTPDSAVTSNQLPVADAGSDVVVMVGELVYFNGTGYDPDGYIVLYEWDFDGNGVYDWSGDTGYTTYVYNTPGTYYARLKVTDNDGGVDVDTRVVEVESSPNQPPVAEAGEDQEVNVHQTVYFTGMGYDEDGYIVLYEWDFDGNGVYDWSSTLTGNTSYVYSNPGTYTAYLRVTDDDGATAVDYCVITVVDTGNQPPVAEAGDDITVAVGETAYFYGSGYDADGYIVPVSYTHLTLPTKA